MTFEMWSVLHIVMIISPFALTALALFFTRNKTYEQKRTIGIILSVFAIITLVFRNVEIYLNQGEITPELIPLQICHFANFVLIYAFIKDSKPSFLFAFAFNLPAAIMSIVFANSLENYSTIINFRGFAYIVGHILIVFITLWAFFSGFIKISKRDSIIGFLIIFSLYIVSVPINNLFNYLMPNYSSNYFYSLKPENGTPLELFFKMGSQITFLKMKFNVIYLSLTLITGALVYISFVGLGIGIIKLKHKNDDIKDYELVFN